MPNLHRVLKTASVMLVAAMLATMPTTAIQWWNFPRWFRRDSLEIYPSRFCLPDGTPRPIAGGAFTIEELKKERADLHEEAKAAYTAAAVIDSETKQPVGLTAEQRTRDDEIDARIEAIDHDIAGLARLGSRQIAYDEESERRIAEAAAATKALGEGGDADAAPKPYKHFGQQLQAIAGAAKAAQRGEAIDPRLMEIQAATGASEAVGTEGGFLVQQDFQTELLKLIHDTGVLVGRADNTPISAVSNSLKINAVDETSRVDGSRQGGIQAYWTAEAGTLTKSKPTYRQMILTLSKLTGLYYATDELLMDTTALASEISSLFAEEFGFKLDDALIRGTGAGMPLGILGHAGTVSVAKETGQEAATIIAENIDAMYARMWARSVGRGTWYINQDCWPQIFELARVVGVGGVPVFVRPNGISEAPFGTLMGRPIEPIEQCETLGTVGDIIFGDFNQYKTIDKGGIEAASSIHVQFLTDEMTFRFILRFDGQPKRNAPLTPYKGGSTKTTSSFITLATRA